MSQNLELHHPSCGFFFIMITMLHIIHTNYVQLYNHTEAVLPWLSILAKGSPLNFPKSHHQNIRALGPVAVLVGAERRFFAEAGVAFDPDTGMTYDGHALDETTGSLALFRWEWQIVPVGCCMNIYIYTYIYIIIYI